MCVRDRSRINYVTHTVKKDRKQLTHGTGVDYELQNSLLVSDRDGIPLIERDYEGDTFFPEFSLENWRMVECETITDDISPSFAIRIIFEANPLMPLWQHAKSRHYSGFADVVLSVSWLA